MIRFRELLRCVGVDEEASGVVVPIGGTNLVLLDTEGGKPLEVISTHPAIEVKEIDGTAIRSKLIDSNIEVQQPDVDPQLTAAMLPTSMFWYDKPRFFEIRGTRVPVGFPGASIQAWGAGQKRRLETSLMAVVLDEKKVKIAIRNVQIADGNGRPTFQTSKPVDANKEKANMDAVWQRQANITFDLISTDPVFINDKDPTTRAKLGRAFGMNEPDNAVFPAEIDVITLESFFAELKVPGALLTFFVVDKLKGGTSGSTRSSGVIFISGSQKRQTTFAHEAGHFFRNSGANGSWNNPGHTYNPDKDQDKRELMRDGGAGWKVTWNLVKQTQTFFQNHKGL
jgi:hypothetical protein